MLVSVWRKKFGAEIRGIDTVDINGDGADEILVASWEAKVYAMNGTGEIMWASHRQEYPCENVKALFDGLGKPSIIVATFHRKIMGFDLNGNKLWSNFLNSWIMKILPIDTISGYGDVLTLDLKGDVAYVSHSGEVLWYRKEISNRWPASIILDSESGNIYSVRGRELVVLTPDGDEIERKKLESEGCSVGIWCSDSLGKRLIVGTKDRIKILEIESLKAVQTIKLKNQADYRTIGTSDIDGDSKDELIIGSWVGDKISIFDYNNEKQKFFFSKAIKAHGNPLSIESADIDGDMLDESIVSLDSNAIVIIHKTSVEKIEAEGSIHGVKFGNALGYGKRDIILRITKEQLACFACVPRIDVEIEQSFSKGVMYALVPAGSRIEVDPVIQIDKKKREFSRRTHSGITVMYYKIPFEVKYRGRVAKVRIVKRKDKILESRIFVPTTEILDPFTKVLAIAREDKIIIPKVGKVSRKKIRITSQNIEIVKTKYSREALELSVTNRNNRIVLASIEIEYPHATSSKSQYYEFYVYPIKTLNIDLKYKNIMRTEDNIEVFVENNASKSIPLSLSASKELEIDVKSVIPPRSSKKIMIKPHITKSDMRIMIRDSIILTYGEHIVEKRCIPIEFCLLNSEKIKQKAKKIYSITKDKNVVLKVLSEEIGIDKNVIADIIGWKQT